MRSWSISTQSETPISWPASPGRSSKVTCFIGPESFQCPSDDAGVALAPIAVADEALVELAGGMARQLALEIDRARAFDRRQALAAIGDELGGELWPDLRPVGGLHHRLHLFAELLVGHADDGDVGDLRVRDEQVLGLLRIDVHAARDDHERLAVGEIEIALGVEPAYVAQRRPVFVLGMARLLRLLRIVVIMEARSTREIDDAFLARGHL